MDYFKHCAKILEFDKILKKLIKYACCLETKNLILQIHPYKNLEIIEKKLNETDEALSFLQRSESFEFLELESPAVSLKKASLGSVLNTHELLNMGLILKQTRLILNFYEQNSEFVKYLKTYFDKLNKNSILENQIIKSIISDNSIADDASEKLKLIRKSISIKKQKIQNVLNNFIKGDNKKYLQDSIISIKNGRYVIAVKSQFSNSVAGQVQDYSAKKSTVFVEPSEVVNLSNELKILESEEEIEIEKILKNLTLNCFENSKILENNYDAILQFDLIFAKAKLALNLNCIKPKITNCGEIVLKKARHPLIEKNTVVPIDVSLGGHFKNLIISGPNTGGKTVALKTIGLFCFMTMCGFLIPAAENSEISIFEQILISIGDEQSIENSLSTFSAHIKNLINILKNINKKSLVLVDEICSGTDPEQGAALAIAVVKNFCNAGSCFAVTTHYTKLKFFAFKNKLVENASFEFDENKLMPTYKLNLGLLGESNAFQISKRIGMPTYIIENAKKLMSQQRLNFDETVSQLNKIKIKLEKEILFQNKKNYELELLQKKLDRERHQLFQKSQVYLEKAKNDANKAVNLVRNEANAILNKLKELKKVSNDENLLKALEKAKSISKNTVGKLLSKVNFSSEKIDKNYKLPKKLDAGDEVLIYDLEKKGVVLEPADKYGKILIEIGSIKTRIELSRLRLVKTVKEKKAKLNFNRSIGNKKNRKIETSVDVRGKTSIDALFMVDNAIDSCILNNISVLTIIHGKGMGILRNAIFKHLKTHKNVQKQRLGDFYEGGDGVTIVELK